MEVLQQETVSSTGLCPQPSCKWIEEGTVYLFWETSVRLEGRPDSASLWVWLNETDAANLMWSREGLVFSRITKEGKKKKSRVSLA
jgi:hypothetical protein